MADTSSLALFNRRLEEDGFLTRTCPRESGAMTLSTISERKLALICLFLLLLRLVVARRGGRRQEKTKRKQIRSLCKHLQAGRGFCNAPAMKAPIQLRMQLLHAATNYSGQASWLDPFVGLLSSQSEAGGGRPGLDWTLERRNSAQTRPARRRQLEQFALAPQRGNPPSRELWMRKLRLFPVPRPRHSSQTASPPPFPDAPEVNIPPQQQQQEQEPTPPQEVQGKEEGRDASGPAEKLSMADSSAAGSSRARANTSKAELAKRKIETLFQSLSIERDAAKKRATELEERLAGMEVRESEKERMRKEHAQREIAFLRERRRPMSEADFEMISIIGKGAFGEVMLVRHKKNGNYYAMKKLRKADMLRKEQVNHAWSERHVLVAANHQFVCQLCYAFQNKDFLYLVMEFLPGGDLMTLLIERDTLTEDDSRFYIAEMVVAIDTIHKLGFIHRDVKPDNLLIDKDGHLKLSDFGLCKSFNVDMESLPASNVNPSAQDTSSTLNELSMTERAAAWRRSARKQAFSTVGT